VDLIKRITTVKRTTTVSVETVKIIADLPELDLAGPE
jgi:hypothetical protein